MKIFEHSDDLKFCLQIKEDQLKLKKTANLKLAKSYDVTVSIM